MDADRICKVWIKNSYCTRSFSNFIEKSKQADIILSEWVFDHSREFSAYNLFLSDSNVFSKLLYPSDNDVYQFIDKIMGEKRHEKRMQLLKQLEDNLIKQGIIVPLYSTFENALFHKDLMGFSLNTIGLLPFERIFFRKN